MKCLDESTIVSFYDRELEPEFEKLIEEHLMTCKACWIKIINYNSSNRNIEIAVDAAEPAPVDEFTQELPQQEEGTDKLPRHQVAEKVFA